MTSFVKTSSYILGVFGLTLLLAPGLKASQQFGTSPFLASQRSVAVAMALVLASLFYGLLAFSLRGFYAGIKRSKSPPWWLWLHPAVVSAGSMERPVFLHCNFCGSHSLSFSLPARMSSPGMVFQAYLKMS